MKKFDKVIELFIVIVIGFAYIIGVCSLAFFPIFFDNPIKWWVVPLWIVLLSLVFVIQLAYHKPIGKYITSLCKELDIAI